MLKPSEEIACEFRDVVKMYHRMHRSNVGFKYFVLRLPTFLRQWRSAGGFTALDHVSFQVRRGESFGLCGRNGSGKSTILGLMAGVLKATGGTVAVRGRISPLLELGAGFHPELTGRDNVYMNAAILGMRRREIDDSFDQIVEFSGLGDFIDEPMRTYSSGMYARLGFSVAVHTEPDILLVDEVLAVGDLAFQRKCLEKMAEFRRSGVTIVFVSHNYTAIRSLCDRNALIHDGKIAAIGHPDEVEPKYQQVMAGQSPF